MKHRTIKCFDYIADNNCCEILSMCHVLKYLIESSKPLIEAEDVENLRNMSSEEWQETVRDLKGKEMILRSIFVMLNISH